MGAGRGVSTFGGLGSGGAVDAAVAQPGDGEALSLMVKVL